MREIVFTSAFRRAYKSFTGKHPELIQVIQEVLEKLSQDPNQPSLETHKLKGKMSGYLACSAGYDLRIIFDLEDKPNNRVLLLDIGTYDEVY